MEQFLQFLKDYPQYSFFTALAAFILSFISLTSKWWGFGVKRKDEKIKNIKIEINEDIKNVKNAISHIKTKDSPTHGIKVLEFVKIKLIAIVSEAYNIQNQLDRTEEEIINIAKRNINLLFKVEKELNINTKLFKIPENKLSRLKRLSNKEYKYAIDSFRNTFTENEKIYVKTLMLINENEISTYEKLFGNDKIEIDMLLKQISTGAKAHYMRVGKKDFDADESVKRILAYLYS